MILQLAKNIAFAKQSSITNVLALAVETLLSLTMHIFMLERFEK